MRITNAMSMNRMLLNINRNARRVDFMYQQLSSGKRIQVPSDNPIIASRALRFRTNVSETEQYMRNARQAESWMRITEEGFKNQLSLMATLRERLNQGATDTLTVEDRDKIVTEMRTFAEQIAGEMNVTFAGRYVFSGFRTDKPPFIVRDDADALHDIIQRFIPSDVLRTFTFVKDGPTDLPHIYEIFKMNLPYKGAGTITATSELFQQELERFIGIQEANIQATYATIGRMRGEVEDIAEELIGLIEERDAATGAAETARLNRLIERRINDMVALGRDIEAFVADNRSAMDGMAAFVEAFYEQHRAYFEIEGVDDFLSSAVEAMEEAMDNLAEEVRDFVAELATIFPPNFNVADIEVADIENARDYLIEALDAIGDPPAGELASINDDLIEAAREIEGTLRTDDDGVPYSFSFVDNARVTLNSPFLYAHNNNNVPPVTRIPIITMASNAANRYRPADGTAHFIPETGELILAPDVAVQVRETGRDGLSLNYNLQRLYEGEPNPVLFFETWDRNPDSRTFNRHFTMDNQHLSFEFGVNTRVQVNNLAKDVFTAVMYAELVNFTASISSATFSSRPALAAHFRHYYTYDADPPITDPDMLEEAVNTAVDAQLVEESRRFADFMHNAFTAMLDRFDEHHASVLREDSILGNRLHRVSITTERLENNRLSFRALMSENEDVDYLEVIMNMAAMEAVYNASMMAGTRIQQMTLADFIR